MNIVPFILWPAYIVSLYILVFWFLFYITKKDEIHKELTDKPNLSYFPFVSVIVPAYNEEKTILKTLISLINLDYPKDKLEIIVVNDGSKDKTADVVQNFINNHKLYEIKLINQKNKGKAACLNKGLSILKGEYFACLDADSFVDKNALKRMLNMHLKDENLAIVTPILKVHKPSNLVQKFQRLEYLASMIVIKLMSYMDCNFIAPGPFSLYKTAIIKKLGGFDEDNLVEDQEVAYKAQKNHYKIRQCSNAYVDTVAPHTYNGLSKQRNRWFKGTLFNLFGYKSLIFNKNYGDFGFFQMPVIFISFLFAFIAMLSLLYHVLRPIYQQIRNLFLIQFDVLAYLSEIKFTFTLLKVDALSTIFIYFMLFLGLIMVYYSSRMTEDRVRKYGTFYLIPYFFVYFLFLSLIAIKVMGEVIIGKKQKW
jgi:cellulose synthase/poly-beta-1,6-N-acetylglucosamine synthase-like glycosyltransferase